MKEKALSEVKKKALEVADSALERVLDYIKEAAQSELGQQLQKKIVSEVGKRSRPAEDIAKAARLGVPQPPPPKKKRTRRKRKGKGFYDSYYHTPLSPGIISSPYPRGLIDQFALRGSGIVLE